MPDLADHPVLLAIVGGVLVLLLGAGIAVVLWRRRPPVERRLQRACNALLADFTVPDGNRGEIHIEYAVLTTGGITVLDLKDVDGHVFGSDNMEEWTVIADRARFTFHNPQHALYDRIAAVKRILPEVPIEGYVVFTERARFSKGRPGHVIMLEALLRQFERERNASRQVTLDAFAPFWDRLRAQAKAARIDQPLRK